MSFTGIFSRSVMGIKSLLAVDDIVGDCGVIACSMSELPSEMSSGARWRNTSN